jgi:hypothetical protein
MRHLTVSVPVRAPSEFTIAYVTTYFEAPAYRDEAGGQSIVFPLPKAAGGASVEKMVRVALKVHRHRERLVEISWDPIDSELFPRFHGSFKTNQGEKTSCVLTLEGEYSPPGGPVGAVFDAVAGSHIARASLESLAQRVGTAAEDDYRLRIEM